MIQLSFLVPARHPWLLLAYPTSLWVKKTPTKGRGYKYPLSRQNRRGRGGWLCRLDKDGLLLNHGYIMQFKQVFELYVLAEVKRVF